jgi:DNA-binding NarL/FixJ family response regulator
MVSARPSGLTETQPPNLVDAVVFETHSAFTPPHDILSDREFQVLQFLVEGRSINDIAEAFVLSATTISTRKVHLMEKLGLGNNAGTFSITRGER